MTVQDKTKPEDPLRYVVTLCEVDNGWMVTVNIPFTEVRPHNFVAHTFSEAARLAEAYMDKKHLEES